MHASSTSFMLWVFSYFLPLVAVNSINQLVIITTTIIIITVITIRLSLSSSYTAGGMCSLP